MTRIILSGCNGKMGRSITNCVDSKNDCVIVAGVDLSTEMFSHFPVFTDFSDITCEADVIIDFSNPVVLKSLLEYSVSKNLPLVIATTGFSDADIANIKAASKSVPIFFSFNMSLGVILVSELCKKAASVLGKEFDVEIIEKHHNQKIDAPSGTAIMLANSVNDAFNNTKTFEYDRHSKRAVRNHNEIGIHSVRGGTIVGEHDVIFAGNDEVITLSHSASSKGVFASGAVNAATFIYLQEPGLYDMKDLVNSKLVAL